MPLPKVKKEVLDLRVTLLGIEPTVWRLIAVPSEIQLLPLHLTIQGAMGWRNAHLHAFEIAGKRYEDGVGSRTSLNRKVAVGDVFHYAYDFGDDWEHEIVVERAYEVQSRRHYPKCLDGARTCPPEDVGGVPGYARFLEILADPTHPECQETLTWAREFWSGIRYGTTEGMPERFDAQSATWQIQAMLMK
jgi:Plasmid pRiA4b ORF-3-like protein